MPEPRSAPSNPDRSGRRADQHDPDQDQDIDLRQTPPTSRDRGDETRRNNDPVDDTRRDDDARNPRHDDARNPRHDDAPRARQHNDDPGYTGRDWRDDPDGRGSEDDHTERPVHAVAGPGTAAGRSSSWGPVLSGAATAFVIFLIFSALWVAIAASGAQAVGDNLAWFQLISGVLAAAAGGAAAGWLDPRGTMTGMIQGLSTWGLLVLATTITGLTTGTALLGTLGNVTVDANIDAANITEMLRPFERELWALFAVLLGGALIAGITGALTGRAHTALTLDDQAHRDETAGTRGGHIDDDRAAARSGSRRR